MNGRTEMPKPRRTAIPSHAMILAAGLGTRMRPLTDVMPKPLVPVDGKPLINHVLDRLAAVGVETAVVNVHHFADQIEQHLKPRRAPKIVISDERDAVLGTGGGVVKALPLLAPTPTSVGYTGRGDFTMAADGKLRRRPEREVVPFVYAGIAVLAPALFRDAPSGAFALTALFDRAIEH